MRKYLLILVCFLLVQAVFAQDVIVKVSGEELKAKVLEITLAEVIYTAPDSVAGKHYNMPKSEVFMVRYANGTKEVFQENLLALHDTTSTIYDPEQLYLLGQQHARVYNKRNGATQLKVEDNSVVSLAYQQDPNYINGYEEGARKRKARKAAIGLGMIGGCLAFLLIVSSTLTLGPGI